MDDEVTRWFDDEPPPRRRRLPALLVAAAVPWVAVAAFLQRGPADPPPVRDAPAGVASAATSTEPDRAPGPGSGAAGPEAGAGATTEPAAEEEPPAPSEAPPPASAEQALATTAVLHGVAEAVVVATTRAWLSDAGPDVDAPGIDVDRSGYLEHVTVERIDLVGDAAAVATVTTVVLRRDEGAYVDALVRRAAVPLTVTPTSVHPAGTPWWLPRPADLTSEPPRTEPIDDATTTAAVADALADAGYRDGTVRQVARADGDLLVADVTATTALGDRVDGPVWFVATVDGPSLLGHHPDDT